MPKPYNSDDWCNKCHHKIAEVKPGRRVHFDLYCWKCSDAFNDQELVEDQISVLKSSMRLSEEVAEYQRTRIKEFEALLFQLKRKHHKHLRIVDPMIERSIVAFPFESQKKKKRISKLRGLKGGAS